MIRAPLLSLVLAVPMMAHAMDATDLMPSVVGLHVASAHTQSGYNGINPGVYARWDSGLTAGAYFNSERRGTVYAGWTWVDAEDRFSVTLGGATGYARATVVPMVVPSVRLGLNEDASVRLSMALTKECSALHLSLERRF
jgi:hypothetical protein